MIFKYYRIDSKVPLLDFNPRNSRSQGGIRAPHRSNPITHSGNQVEMFQNMKNSGNLWYHQREEKDEAKRKARIFLDGLNEQRKMEKQRKLIDEKFEAINEIKIQQAKQERILKEDGEREDFRRKFEDASKKNDLRINYYLNHYYAPPEEKELRNNMSSDRKRGIPHVRLRTRPEINYNQQYADDSNQEGYNYYAYQ